MRTVKILTLSIIIALFLSAAYSTTYAASDTAHLDNVDLNYYLVQEKNKSKSDTKTKFYNFDDLLINGKVRKPQILYTDARQKVRFDRLLKLKKNFIPNLIGTKKDPTFK